MSRRGGLHFIQRDLPVLGGVNDKPKLLQQLDFDFPVDLVVLRQQDALGRLLDGAMPLS